MKNYSLLTLIDVDTFLFRLSVSDAIPRYVRLLRFDNDNRGCRWIFDREYRYLRPLLEAPYFVAVQIFFTIGFGLLIAACGVLLALNICFPQEKEVQMLRATTGLILASMVCTLVAIIVFGTLGDLTNDYIPQVRTIRVTRTKHYLITFFKLYVRFSRM